MRRILRIAAATALAMAGGARAESGSRAVGEPVLERPTLHCLGAYWVVRGDDNANAAVSVDWRKAGEPNWRSGMPLLRVDKGAHKDAKYGSRVEVPEGAWLFAGSVVGLAPGTAYEVRLKLVDPDGGGAVEKVLAARTITEPAVAAGAPVRHVAPGAGGGSGTEADPFRGLAAAQAAARPGDVMLLAAGTYAGTFTINKQGEPGRPIVWRGRDGAILDAQGADPKRPGRAISASDAHDVWFENLTIRNADYGIVAHDAARIVVRRCRINGVDYGFTSTRDERLGCNDLFISDNVIEGPSRWPRAKGIESARGVQVTGAGHVICYNRIRGFADAIDTFPGRRCEAIDVHNNDLSELTDDGIEMDYSQRNTRCFENRLTNVFQGISLQPVHGGPVYVFRNAMYNVGMEPFKLHNQPSGGMIFHNTSVKRGMPLALATSEKVRNCVSRNNLFVGTTATYAYECQPAMERCDFDYDGFAGGPFKMFLKWNGRRYATVEELRAKGPVYRHAVIVDAATAFAAGVRPPEDGKVMVATPPDLRLAAGSGAVDAGVVIPGLNDGASGKAPDLGAYELGGELPHYGPRPVGARE